MVLPISTHTPRVETLQQTPPTVQARGCSGARLNTPVPAPQETPVRVTPEERLRLKWEKTGLDPQVVQIAPDCARFLLETKMGFVMGSLSHPETQEIPLRVVGGQVELMVEGEFIPWAEFQDRFEFDPARWHNALIERDETRSVWTFVSPRLGGFVKKDPYLSEKPYPIDKLTPEELARVRAQASQDPTNTRNAEAVIQVYTSPGGEFAANGCLKAMTGSGEYGPSHYAVQIISPTGEVYSMTHYMDLGEVDIPGKWAFLSTKKGRVVMGDYDLWRPHHGRILTSLPMTKQDMENVFNEVDRKRDAPFSFLKYNCASFAADMLTAAGYPVRIETHVENFLFPALFGGIKNIPVLGPFLVSAASKVSSIAAKIWNFIPSIIQKAIRFVFRAVTAPIWFGGRVILNLTILLCMGWHQTPRAKNNVEQGGLDGRPIKNFWDLFKDETRYFQSSVELMKWQKRHPLTRTLQGTTVAKLQT